MTVESITPEPAALRAMSHPVRLRILGMLRIDGPATASSLATRLSLNSGATSYHLRQLAAHGFVVDDLERGNRRERWWRAAHRTTQTDVSVEQTPEGRDALDAFGQAVAIVHTEQLQRAVEERPLLPDAWRRTAQLSDWQLRLTPQRAEELTRALLAVITGWAEDSDDTRSAETFTVLLHTFPRPGRVTAEVEGGAHQ